MNVRLYRAKGPERLAFVSVLPASSGTGMLVQVAKGPNRAALLDTRVYGPLSRAEIPAVVERELEALRAQGFRKSGLFDLLTALESKRRRVRALAVVRLGWLREPSAVEPLLALAAKANEELPVVIDALGEIGDVRALSVVRAAAEKKLLSRRRSGVEALRKLGDPSALADAKNRALERLPSSVQVALAAADATAGSLVDAVRGVPLKQRGVAIDTLYELDTPSTVAAVRTLLEGEAIGAPHLWRYAKSVLKRAMLRHDFETFGALMHRIEIAARGAGGTVATVKSGFDGEMKEMRIFGASTTQYVRRAGWRYLRRLAQHRPELYVVAAAEALIPYSPQDQEVPVGLYGGYSASYLLNRILFGASARHTVDGRTLRTRIKKANLVNAKAGIREEAHPTLWDLHPEGYVRLLSAARLPLVHAFAVAAIQRAHREALERASHADVAAMLAAPYEPTVDLALTELRRRFDPAHPDVDLLRALLGHARPQARELGLEWLSTTTSHWTASARVVLSFLESADAAVRAAVVAHVLAALAAPAGATPETRRALAEGLLHVLAQPEAESGAHDAHAQIAHVLVDDIAAMAPIDLLLGLLADGAPAAQGVAALALASRADAEAVLGRERLTLMAVDAHAAVRRAAHAILGRNTDALTADPSPLYALLDSEWLDARSFAAGLLRTTLDVESLSLDALVGLCDAHHVDVQRLGTELVERRMDTLSADDLIERLAQHPHRNMRKFTLRLVTEKLKPGFIRLAALEEFFRTVLLDVMPDRPTKRAAIAFLAARGLADEHQAEIALRLLGELARSRTRDDFERTVVAMTHIKIAFPRVDGGIELAAEGHAP
ncbi:hypothetical protein LVJ94_19525 [Pendulispora rubella]|uniref:HEAT repeat domain-containing protein n=1 Tax=Pendulispora rubella TaxID=2741070 RepID=A0ABZ2LET7_9BACT